MKTLVITLFAIIALLDTTSCQKKPDFIKITKSSSVPIPPFPIMETEISDYKICYRNVLPPRQNMDVIHLDVYDSWNQEPRYVDIDTTEYDSLLTYIFESKLLILDIDYSKPDKSDELIVMSTGASGVKYKIYTKDNSYDFPISGAISFDLPIVLKEFDELFMRISKRYASIDTTASH